MSSLKKIISMFVLLALSITQVSAVNIPIEHLNVSNDYASVQTAGTDICNLVNTLTESSTLHSDNINWDNVYKIYVDDNDIFALSSYSKNDIINSLDYIWSYMDNINNHNIRVTISRAQMPEHELVDNGVINETTYNELVKKAGTWTAPEAEIDTTQTIANILSDLQKAGISDTTDFILVGGTDKMKSLFAITFSDGYADKIIPLAETGIAITKNSDAQEISTYANTENLESLDVGKAYDFKMIANAFNSTEISLENDSSDSGYTSNSNTLNAADIVIMVSAPFIILTILYIFRKKKMAK
jgi:hypothetical protein